MLLLLLLASWRLSCLGLWIGLYTRDGAEWEMWSGRGATTM